MTGSLPGSCRNPLELDPELVCMGVKAVYSVLFTAFNRWLLKPPKAHS